MGSLDAPGNPVVNKNTTANLSFVKHSRRIKQSASNSDEKTTLQTDAVTRDLGSEVVTGMMMGGRSVNARIASKHGLPRPLSVNLAGNTTQTSDATLPARYDRTGDGIAVAPSPSLWTPAKLTLNQWYDASDVSSVMAGLAGDVSQWNDKSGNGLNAVQAATNSRPHYHPSDTQNGLRTMHWPSKINDDETMGAATAWLAFEAQSAIRFLAIVWKYTDQGSAIGTTWRSYVPMALGSNMGSSQFHGATTGDNDGDGMPDPGAPVLIDTLNTPSVIRNASSRKNGSAISLELTACHTDYALMTVNTVAGGSNVISADNICADGPVAGMQRALIGHIGEIIISNETLSSDNVNLIEGYLAHKWGLEGNLPGSHPYKSAAPTTY